MTRAAVSPGAPRPAGGPCRSRRSMVPMASSPPPRLVWDAGTLGCGDLVMALRGKVREVAPGEVLEVVARDAGAAEDVPSWCRLTGNPLLEAAPPVYRIRRKEA